MESVVVGRRGRASVVPRSAAELGHVATFGYPAILELAEVAPLQPQRSIRSPLGHSSLPLLGARLRLGTGFTTVNAKPANEMAPRTIYARATPSTAIMLPRGGRRRSTEDGGGAGKSFDLIHVEAGEYALHATTSGGKVAEAFHDSVDLG